MKLQKQIKLNNLRDQIDLVDTLLIKCLAKRQEFVKEISGVKKENDISIFCPDRERQLLKERKRLASLLCLDLDFINDIFQKILENSKKTQEIK